MKDITAVKDDLTERYRRLGTWDKVAEEVGLYRALVWKIAKKDLEPLDESIRKKLGMGPPPIPAEPCHICGKVHTKGHPSGKPRKWQYNYTVIDPELHTLLETYRQDHGTTRAAMVREGLRLLLEHEG